MGKENKHVMILDREQIIAYHMAQIMEEVGFQTTTFHDRFDPTEGFVDGCAYVVIMELMADHKKCAETIERIRGMRSDIKFLFVSVHSKKEISRITGMGESFEYLQKPFKNADLIRIVDSLFGGASRDDAVAPICPCSAEI